MRALKFEEFDAVKLLLSVADVDVNEVDSRGQSLAELAVINNYQELLELMLTVERLDWNSISNAAKAASAACVSASEATSEDAKSKPPKHTKQT